MCRVVSISNFAIRPSRSWIRASRISVLLSSTPFANRQEEGRKRGAGTTRTAEDGTKAWEVEWRNEHKSWVDRGAITEETRNMFGEDG